MHRQTHGPHVCRTHGSHDAYTDRFQFLQDCALVMVKDWFDSAEANASRDAVEKENSLDIKEICAYGVW